MMLNFNINKKQFQIYPWDAKILLRWVSKNIELTKKETTVIFFHKV